ncbi:MAG: DUF4118 domain-containing protein [Verrucomicrobia bacterium]|nr:DUF4118 domain-containing protein [Verrucomicrobiota bacterium]
MKIPRIYSQLAHGPRGVGGRWKSAADEAGWYGSCKGPLVLVLTADFPPGPGSPPAPGREYWLARPASAVRELAEVTAVVLGIAFAGWFAPVTYHVFGYVYLFAVIALSLRVGRWPVLFAAVASAVVWNYVFIPPRLSFSVLDFDDSLMLGTYCFAALIGGQLTARIRAQERTERQRERRASALLHLSRALTAARSFDEAAAAALRQADGLFSARTALLLAGETGELAPHPAGSYPLTAADAAAAPRARHAGVAVGRLAHPADLAPALHVPLRRAERALGVFVVALPAAVRSLTLPQRDLIEAFAAQIALLVEREQLRAASERERRLAESERLHRTLLDSVSHELKTPLAVLRSAVERLEAAPGGPTTVLTAEIRTAAARLDDTVANLLHQTRLESGAVRPRLDWCDPRDLITAARRRAGDALANRPVTLEIEPDVPLVRTDAVLTEHALANLLLNAARHTPAGSAVRIAARCDVVNPRLRLEVGDRGPGIPVERRRDLFQKFQRGPRAPAGGLGLGLSIARGFMLAQGGDAVVSDEPGGGACFSLLLPFAEPAEVPDDDR